MNWRNITTAAVISLTVATVVTLTASSFDVHDARLLLQPGIVAEVMLDWVLLLIPTGDAFLSLPQGSHLLLNVNIYSSVIFGLYALTMLAHRYR